MVPRLDRLLPGLLAQKIILSFANTKYKRSPHSRHDSSSFAPQVLQQCKSRREKPRNLSRLPAAIPTFDGRLHENLRHEQLQNPRPEPPLTVSIDLRDAV